MVMLDEFYLFRPGNFGSEIEKLAGLRKKIDDSAVRESFYIPHTSQAVLPDRHCIRRGKVLGISASGFLKSW
jgi:hypothetical protein